MRVLCSSLENLTKERDKLRADLQVRCALTQGQKKKKKKKKKKKGLTPPNPNPGGEPPDEPVGPGDR